jgi:hypothetical protein
MTWGFEMKFIKIIILLVAVFSIAGMAFFQLLLLLISALFAKQTGHSLSSWLRSFVLQSLVYRRQIAIGRI